MRRDAYAPHATQIELPTAATVRGFTASAVVTPNAEARAVNFFNDC